MPERVRWPLLLLCLQRHHWPVLDSEQPRHWGPQEIISHQELLGESSVLECVGIREGSDSKHGVHKATETRGKGEEGWLAVFQSEERQW